MCHRELVLQLFPTHHEEVDYVVQQPARQGETVLHARSVRP